MPRAFGYNAQTLQPETGTIVAGTGGLYSKTITRAYHGSGTDLVPGRDAGFSIGTEYGVTYAYDGYGRFNSITGSNVGLPENGVSAIWCPTAEAPGWQNR